MSQQSQNHVYNKISATVCALLSGETDLIAVYLFGSQAEGGSHAHSDVDVAILFQDELGRHQRFRRLLAIGTELELALPVAVDLIDLHRAPPLLKFHVLKYGTLLIDFDRTKRCIFEMHALQIYYDAKPYLDYQQMQTIQRIQEQGLGHGHNSHRRTLEKARQLRRSLARAASSIA